MADAKRIIGVVKAKTSWLKESTRTILSLFLICSLVIGAIILWKYIRSDHRHFVAESAAPPTVAQFEKQQQNNTSSYLKDKNYINYQRTQQDLAIEYMANKDYTSAERVMNDVFKNTPTNKMNSESYMVMIEVEKNKGNTSEYKKYLKLAIDKLNAEGDKKTAALYQDELKGIQ
ncbi:MAG TPA: hypothetical protein VLF88_02250 [Candidatus Babeliales bacterium]|nr:hypothetical protein [Candidatus Babeliales bacterium]